MVFNNGVSFIYPPIQFVVSGRDFVCIFFPFRPLKRKRCGCFSWEFSSFVVPGTSQEDCQSFQHRRLQQITWSRKGRVFLEMGETGRKIKQVLFEIGSL